MSFHRDKIVKFDYNPVLNAQIDYLNAVGATDSTTLRTLDFTPSDINTVYVAKTGSDSTGTGTAANPVLTIKKAESLITAVKCNIVILDDGVYEEESLAFDTNCRNIAAAIGKKPTIKPILVATSAANYFVDTIKASTVISATAAASGRRLSSAVLTNGNYVFAYGCNGLDLVYGCFIIVNKDGNVIVSETVFASNNKDVVKVVALKNGTFVILYKNTSMNHNYIVYNNDGQQLYTGGEPDAGGNYLIGECGGYTDAFVLIYQNSSVLTKFAVINTSGTILVAPTALAAFPVETVGHIKPIPSGGFVYAVRNDVAEGTGIFVKWGIVAKNGTILHSGQLGGGAVSVYSAGIEVQGNNVLLAYNTGSYDFTLESYSLSSYGLVKSAVIATEAYTPTDFELSMINSNAIAVTYYASPTAKVKVLSLDWNILYAESLGSTTSISSSYNPYVDRLFIVYSQSSGSYLPIINVKGGFLTDWLMFSSDITFNGIVFNNIEDYIYRFIYSSSGVFKVKWCDFLNISQTEYKDEDTYPLYVATITGSNIQILNCKVYNNDAGFKLTSNSVLVQYCQFFKQLLNPAIYVIGAGAGIIINHNDFLYNYVSVKLEDNNGLEVLKNNIFYTSLLYSIQAETVVTYTNSVENAVSFNATAGTQVIRSHPHYINDGYVSLEVMDLVLKSRELGYRFESPAIRLGDDLKNAGSVEFEIADGSRTWDTIYVMKPNIKKGYNPVGAIETIYKDGDVDTYRDSSTEVLKLEWDSLTEADFQKLLTLYFCSNNLVQITLDPESEPGVYGTYRLVYDKINASPKNWQFDDIGKNDFDLTFKRAYNEGL